MSDRNVSIGVSVLVLLALGGATVPGFVQSGTGPLKLSEHVWVVPEGQPGAQSNVGIVVGSKGTLVIDSGLGPRNGAILAGVAREHSIGTTIYVAGTHFHPEHMMGESGFPASAIVLRSKAQQHDIDETGATNGEGVVALFRGMPARVADMEGAIFRPPDLLFEGDSEISLGDVRVRLIGLGPGHTNGDLGFFVEGDGVLFTGDIAMSQPLGINPNSIYSSAPTRARVWLASLERLVALRPAHVVPSHGPLGDVSIVERHRLFMREVEDRVRGLKAERQNLDQVLASVGKELSGKHSVPETTAVAAARLFYQELP